MRSLTGREGSGSNRSPPQSLLVIEKDGSVFGRNWRRRTCGQKTAQDRDRDNQLAHSRHLLSRSKLLRLRPRGSRSSTTVARTSGAADRVGSGAAFAQGTWAARAAAMPVSILPSRTELFILANAASPASFRGSREYTRDGNRRRDVTDGDGDAPREPGPGAVVERRREPVGAEPAVLGPDVFAYVDAARLSALPMGSPADSVQYHHAPAQRVPLPSPPDTAGSAPPPPVDGLRAVDPPGLPF